MSYLWNFGDGSVIGGSIPVLEHTYAAPGIYYVSFGAGNGEYFASESRKITVLSSADPAEISQSATVGSFGIFPNPASYKITVELGSLKGEQPGSLEITDGSGQRDKKGTD